MPIITPTLDVTVDKSKYQPGDTGTLVAVGNHKKKRTFKFEPDLGFTQTASDELTDTFTFTAPAEGGEVDVKVTMHRTWDGSEASDTVHVSTTVPLPPLTLSVSMPDSDFNSTEGMVLNASSNATAEHTYTVSDADAQWAATSDGQFTAIAPNKSYNGTATVTVTRAADGASKSATASYKVTLPVVAQSTLFGVSMSDEDHGLPHWDAAHCYNMGDVDESQRAPITAKAVCFSDSARWTVTGTVDAAAVKSDLQKLRAKYPKLIIRYSWGNEVDRHVSSAQIAKYVSNLKALRGVVDSLNDPLTTLWTSFTKGIFEGGSWLNSTVDQWKPIAPVVDGIAVNLYPPSRDDSPLVASKISKYSDFIDKSIDTVAAWGVKKFACWEVGHPVFNFTSNPAPYRNRPEYIKGLRDYVVARCKQKGITCTEICYWDQMMAEKGKFDNRLYLDEPKTAQAFVS